MVTIRVSPSIKAMAKYEITPPVVIPIKFAKKMIKDPPRTLTMT